MMSIMVRQYYIVFPVCAELLDSPSIERYRLNTQLPSDIRAKTL
jgi:hypothetical protein